jgi:hypothetical protein
MSQELYAHAVHPIREKFDLIRLLTHIIKVILTEPYDQLLPQDCNKIVIYVNKMSRVFICIDQKFFSFHFPFFVNVSDSKPRFIDLTFSPFFQLDNASSSLLLTLFNQPNFFETDLCVMYTSVLEEIIEEEWPVTDIDSFLSLVKYLLIFEPGYFRYDHDEARSRGRHHPKHHIDFYYSSNNTFKLGLNNDIRVEWLIDMVDILTECKYIQ